MIPTISRIHVRSLSEKKLWQASPNQGEMDRHFDRHDTPRDGPRERRHIRKRKAVANIYATAF